MSDSVWVTVRNKRKRANSPNAIFFTPEITPKTRQLYEKNNFPENKLKPQEHKSMVIIPNVEQTCDVVREDLRA